MSVPISRSVPLSASAERYTPVSLLNEVFFTAVKAALSALQKSALSTVNFILSTPFPVLFRRQG